MSHAMIGGNRALRVCDACGQVDDHPRHAILGDPQAYPAPSDETVGRVIAACQDLGIEGGVQARLLRDLMSTAVVDLHMDCCRARGCPTGACDQVTANAESLRGAKLLDHLVELEPTVTVPS